MLSPLLTFLLSLVFCNFIQGTVFAEDNSTLRVAISPAIQRMELDPNAVYKNNITVTNDSDRDAVFYMSAAPYSVEEINYAPIYTVRNAYTQIASWITFSEDEVEVPAHNSVVVDYIVTVPADAPGGGQYAVIFAEARESGEQSSIQPAASPGMLVMAKLSGTTRETGEIKDTKISNFLLAPPVSASVTLENTGNIDASSKVSLKIENYFSGEVIYDGSATPVENVILPGTSRTVDISHSNVPRLGILKATLTTEFLGDAEIKTRIVFICPIWFIVLVVLILAVLIFRIISRKHSEKKTRSNSRNTEGTSGNFNL